MTKYNSAALCAIALAYLVGGCMDRNAPSEPTAVIEAQLQEALAIQDEVDVIVNLHTPDAANPAIEPERYRRDLGHLGDELIAAAVDGFEVTRRFKHVPAIAGRISRRALETLARDPRVAFIQLDGGGHGALAVSVPAIGADIAKRDGNVTGKGVRVAVLDTGINTSHADLKSSVVATQRCFTQRACPPNNAAEGTSAEDDHGHGSHVSGIVTSDGVVAGAGFAPGAEIVAVKINDRNDSGMVSDWVAGLDWLYGNLATLNVKIVNMSICSDQLYSSQSACDSGQPALARSVKNLVDAGVTLFAASGNTGSSSQLAAPACNSGVIAVGATYKSNQGRQPSSGTYSSRWGSSFGNCADDTTAFDKVACFTNSPERLDLLAPGAAITSDTLGTGTEQYWGTSQASPSAAGVAALMLECNPKLSPAQVKDILVRTGVSVTDPKSSRSFPSIRANLAVEQACASSGAAGAGGHSSTGGQSSGGAAATGGSASVRGGNGGTGGSTPGTGASPSTGGTSTNGGKTAGGQGTGATLTGGAASLGGANAGGQMTGGAMTGGAMTGGTMTGGSVSVGGQTGNSSTGGNRSAGGAFASVGGASDGGTPAAGGATQATSGGTSAVEASNSLGNDDAGSCNCRMHHRGTNPAVALGALVAILVTGLRRRRAVSPV